MLLLTSVLLLALSRAELIARFKAPIITQADGMIKVYADCPEDMRREYQVPVARFATETVRALDRMLKRRGGKLAAPHLVIHLGDVRTNRTDVLSRAVTNGTHVITRITLPSPGFADLTRFRAEVIRAYYRGLRGEELTVDAALDIFRATDPELRRADEQVELAEFVHEGRGDHERGLELMRKIITPGRATRQDVLIFASRLFLYPPYRCLRFAGRYDRLSFREALDFARIDPRVRVVAYAKAGELPAFGGGRGETLQRTAYAYMDYLLALAEGKRDDEELKDLLEKADSLLNVTYEQCVE